MEATFGIDPSEILQISAKTGKGVEAVLKAIIERIPPPNASAEDPLKAFLFDSLWDIPVWLGLNLTLATDMTSTVELFP